MGLPETRPAASSSFSFKPVVPEDPAFSHTSGAGHQPNTNESQRPVSIKDSQGPPDPKPASQAFSFASPPATGAQQPALGFIHFFGQPTSTPQETRTQGTSKHIKNGAFLASPINFTINSHTTEQQSSTPRFKTTTAKPPGSKPLDRGESSPDIKPSASGVNPPSSEAFRFASLPFDMAKGSSTTMPIRPNVAKNTSAEKPTPSKKSKGNVPAGPPTSKPADATTPGKVFKGSTAEKTPHPPVRNEKMAKAETVRAATKDGVKALKGAPAARPPKQNARRPLTSDSTEEDSSDGSKIDSVDSGDDQVSPSDQPRSASSSEEESEPEELLNFRPGLLHRPPGADDLNEITSSPLFTPPVWKHAMALGKSKSSFPQYALLGGNSDSSATMHSDEPLFYNVSAPSSVFICGSQGSGKSHTLSCFLENCLVPSKELGRLPRPLTGVVFHYDTFISDLSGTPCEAAYLASNRNVKVRVLCAPTNIRTMRHTYSRLRGVTVEELRLKESDLNTKRMLDLMAVGAGGAMPLYMHVIQRLLRDMRIEQQNSGSHFNYLKFKLLLQGENLTPMQSVPLQQRLETLESFMVGNQGSLGARVSASSSQASRGTDWTPVAGQLTIVDLSCPCVTSEMACSLFNICLSLFLEQKKAGLGRVVALDEAHKYMTESAEAQTLTNSLLSSIRLQRHEALRVIIATQEPTISTKLLDLCSITVVHRFQSPDWMRVLKGHLAGLSTTSQILAKTEQTGQKNGDGDEDEQTAFEGLRGINIAPDNPTLEMMSHIIQLRTGEALIFAPSAIVGLERKGGLGDGDKDIVVHKRLDHAVMRVRIRARLTADGGRSVMAT